MPAHVVTALVAASQRRDATQEGYVSDDRDSRQLEEILRLGFRWVRTDGDLAVFERKAVSR